MINVEWMRNAAAAGEAALLRDDAIRRRNPDEARVLIEILQALVVCQQPMPADKVSTRFLASRAATERDCR